jgi:hypothetical protein
MLSTSDLFVKDCFNNQKVGFNNQKVGFNINFWQNCYVSRGSKILKTFKSLKNKQKGNEI